jgi:protoheme IX farnesyltransferase
MLRTCKRPLATGYLDIRTGILISVLLITAGLFALLLLGNSQVFLLGIFAVIWYNGLYTSLKRLTPFAILPGSLCGAIPPIMGWLLAGGSVLDYRIMLLAGIIVLWQVPHFWLLALSYPEDARRSGLPNLFSRIKPEKLRRLILIWIIALLAGATTSNLFGLLRADAIRIGLMTATLLFTGILLRYGCCRLEPAASDKLFVRLNLFMTLWLGGIAIDRYAVESNQFVIHILTFFG